LWNRLLAKSSATFAGVSERSEEYAVPGGSNFRKTGLKLCIAIQESPDCNGGSELLF